MTWSAPIDRTMSTFVALATPVTSAPKAMAICRANEPTPPEAPMINTVCPAWTSPRSRTPCSAVSAEMVVTAAWAKVRFAGLGASVLGEGALGDAEHVVADPKRCHRLADRLDTSGDFSPAGAVLGCADAVAREANR